MSSHRTGAPSDAPAAAGHECPAASSEFDLAVGTEGAKTLAEHTAKAFADENDRVKTIDTKAGLFFSATGAVIGLIAGTLIRLPDPVARSPQVVGWYLVLVCLALLVFFAAEVCFLVALMPRTFQFLAVEAWLEPEVAQLPPEHLHLYFARSYTQARRKSIHTTGPKVSALTCGQWLLIAGLLVLVIGVAPLVAWATYTSLR